MVILISNYFKTFKIPTGGQFAKNLLKWPWHGGLIVCMLGYD